jgi:hypothetical protein
VVIGNPPYIEYNAKNCAYKINNYETISCGNLYAFVLERETRIICPKGRMGNIVPVSIMSTPGYFSLRKLLHKLGASYFASYNIHPCCLFDGAHPRLSIVFNDLSHDNGIYVSRYHKWTADERKILFLKCYYLRISSEITEKRINISLPKISSEISNDILSKMMMQSQKIGAFLVSSKFSGVDFYYRRAFGAFILFYDKKPQMFDEEMRPMDPTEMKTLRFETTYKDMILSIYHSSLFYWFTYTFSDCRNINKPEVEDFAIDLDKCYNSYGRLLGNLSKKLSVDLQDNSKFLEYNYSSGWRKFQAFYPRNSKPIIDEIDKVLAKHYGFTEEELDFIINYDIKYRMGDELNENE